jgi:hypothetical protein
MKRKNTPLTIANEIATSLGLPDMSWSLSARPARMRAVARIEAVAEILASFYNYTLKGEIGQQGFFAGMIIRILTPERNAVNFEDLKRVIELIVDGNEKILQEMKEEREERRARLLKDKSQLVAA